MSTLAEFLLARIAEDEVAVRAIVGEYALFIDPDDGTISEPMTPKRWDAGPGYERWADGDLRLPNRHGTWMSLYDPARVLAECEAKRRIVDLAWENEAELEGEWGRGRSREEMEAAGICPDVLVALAQPYADHPDFRQEWRAGVSGRPAADS